MPLLDYPSRVLAVLDTKQRGSAITSTYDNLKISSSDIANGMKTQAYLVP